MGVYREVVVNKIHSFVTKVYLRNYHKFGHYPSSCLLFNKHVSETSVCLRLQLERTHFGSMDKARQAPS
jgi:hypothetical protein